MKSPDLDSLYGVFSQVIRYHRGRIHSVLEKYGAYPGQPPLLFILGEHSGLSQKELADKLHIKAATITIMLKRMEKAGLVERCADADDQRRIKVYLTDKGREMNAKAVKALEQIGDECFENFTEEEKILLRRLLLQMLDNLKNKCDVNKHKD